MELNTGKTEDPSHDGELVESEIGNELTESAASHRSNRLYMSFQQTEGKYYWENADGYDEAVAQPLAPLLKLTQGVQLLQNAFNTTYALNPLKLKASEKDTIEKHWDAQDAKYKGKCEINVTL